MAFWHEICDDKTIEENNKRIKDLPAEIKKSSEENTKKWEKPAYETGANSDRRTLEICLDELSQKWTTENGSLVVEEMYRLNEDINATLKNMKSSLLSLSKVTMNVSYVEYEEEVEL
jgi:hypothetical protein